jgi:two-component system LytT family response regulator
MAALNIVIVEDEKPAAQKLAKDLLQVDPSIQIVKIIHNVEHAIRWFNEHSNVDLVFMDVELTDGLSFEILEEITIDFPIIFVTAYDHYWQSALKSNGIDYLLKPVELRKLKEALAKYSTLRSHFTGKLETLIQAFTKPQEKSYKEKFLVRRGKELVIVPVEDIVLFKASDKVILLYTSDSRKLIVEESLLKLTEILDPKIFVRANRKFIVNIDYIEKVSMYSKGRIDIKMKYTLEESIIVAQDKAASFKSRLEGII